MNKHPTKSGPGRTHGQGVAHGFVPVQRSGAGPAFAQHHASPKRSAKRALVAVIGVRQYKRRMRAA